MKTSIRRSQVRSILSSTLVAAMLASAFGIAAHSAMADGPGYYTRQLVSGGTSQLQAGGEGFDGFAAPELRRGPSSQKISNEDVVNRSFARGHGARPIRPLPLPKADSSAIATSNPGLGVSFNGLNFRQQRLANNGNQFSVEPPDQGLCVGNGYVLESVNQVLRVFDTNGNPLSGVVDQNTFYGYPPAIIRNPLTFGPFVTDPSCIYDPDTQRFVHIVLTLDVDPATGAFLGPNHLDIAVSPAGTPLGVWNIYRIPVQNDGTDGTPNHGCSFGPCIGDYPHIGYDRQGVYITTNEYSFFGPEYKFANIYAISKAQLAAGVPNPTYVLIDNTSVGGLPGFTVWPALPAAGQYADDQGGTEYFLSTMAAEEASGQPGVVDNRIGLWALTNTSSLNSSNPSLNLQSRIMPSVRYTDPPKSEQKAGSFPLGECINDTTIPTPFGVGCWNFFFFPQDEPAHDEVLSKLDSSDSRMQQVYYADGKLWGALGTAVEVNGAEKAGIAYVVIRPNVTGNGQVVGNRVTDGYVAVANNNVTYPAVAVLPNGKGVMAFTLVGNDHYPSAGYVHIDAKSTGDVHIAAAGVGPQDGFTGYKAFDSTPDTPPRPRWGDYGAAVVVGNDIWIASEYIAQTCTLAQYMALPTFVPFGSCGGTRASLGNWATRLSAVTP